MTTKTSVLSQSAGALARSQGLAQREILATKILAETAGAVALGGALNLLKIYSLPQGGSVTLGAMVPLLLLALRRGPWVGILAGEIFGGVVLIEEPISVHPVQVLLDYPMAFGALGLAGLLRQRPLVGVAVGIASRFVFHFISGIFFFTLFNLDGVLYSAVYNGSYLLPELAISAIIVQLLVRRRVLELYL